MFEISDNTTNIKQSLLATTILGLRFITNSVLTVLYQYTRISLQACVHKHRHTNYTQPNLSAIPSQVNEIHFTQNLCMFQLTVREITGKQNERLLWQRKLSLCL